MFVVVVVGCWLLVGAFTVTVVVCKNSYEFFC